MRPTRSLVAASLAALLLAGPVLAMKLFPGRISGRFEASIDPSESGMFAEVDGLVASVEVVEYREGGINSSTHKLIGPTRYSNIVLRRGASILELLRERLAVVTDPDEMVRLEDLIARLSAAEAFRLMLTNFDPRTRPDDDLFFNAVVADVFLKDGCDLILVTAQVPIPDVPVLDVIDPDNLRDSRQLKRVFNSKKDTVNGLLATQKLAPDAPVLEWTSGEPMHLNIELFFDGYESKEDVKKDAVKLAKKTNKLPFKLMKPPMLSFEWGSMHFDAALKKLEVRYTMFKPDGTPVRAKTTVQMSESSSSLPETNGS